MHKLRRVSNCLKIALYQQKSDSDKESGCRKENRMEAYAPSASRKADIKMLKEENLVKKKKQQEKNPTIEGEEKVLISQANEIENGVNYAQHHKWQ